MAGEPDGWYQQATSPVMVVLSGPSGVGKDAVLNRMKEMGYPFHFVVTATTRPPRPGEVNGVDYHFVSASTFAEMMDKGELLEHAVVYGEYKGIPKSQVREALASGKDVIMRIDVQGAATIRRLVKGATLIFLNTASEEELVERLLLRRTESPDKLKLRIATARQELKRIAEFDYCVVNHHSKLDETARQLAAIITAERLRVGRRPVEL
ncbi:MAG: guanylate kinase [Anaerolineae bacterium]|nr:guanylate kinase [Anaerolineae bacterium]